MNIDLARENMIKQQFRTWHVQDDQIIEILSRIPREDFVPAAYKNIAFADTPLPLAEDQVMMNPKQEARMLQALQIQPDDEVLEVGTGSGYVTALLADSAKHVCSVEYHANLLEQAREKLSQHGINNVSLEQGDAANGWGAKNMYEVIVLTGSVPILSQNFLDALTVDGRLFAIIGDYPVMEATLITRTDNTHWTKKVLFETEVPALINAPKTEQFIF